MRLRVYHAGDGDCVLISDDSQERHLLIDGGRKGTYELHTRDDLTMNRIDVICVSHIDDDHISGILRLFEDEVSWRRHRFEKSRGLPSKKPKAPPPPDVGEVWHNALFRLLGEDMALEAATALTATANLLRARGLADDAVLNENVVTGEKSAMELSRRLSPHQLNIDVNDSSNGDILTRDSARGRRFGRMRVKVIAPSQEDIDRLKVVWRAWIDANPTALDELRKKLRRSESGLSAGESSAPVTDLGSGVGSITAPNLASIALLIEEGDVSVLLTGDGDSAELLFGLEATGEMDPLDSGDSLANLTKGKRFHCNVLKVQHHGAFANVTEEFVARVTADHYVFCGNGAHHNPELGVVRAFAEARLNGLGPATGFKFWFSSGSGTPRLTEPRRKHMGNVEQLVAQLSAASGGRMEARFMQDNSHFDVPLPALSPPN